MTVPGLTSLPGRTAAKPRFTLNPDGVSPGTLWFIVGMNVIMTTLFILSANSIVAIFPLFLFCLCCLFLVTSLRKVMFVLLFIVAASDATVIPFPDKSLWFPPLYWLQYVLVENLNKTLPIEALRFSLLEVIFVAMAVLAVARVGFRIRVDTRGRGRGTVALTFFLFLSFAGVLWLEFYGVGVRGGDFRQSLWQFRQLFWLPLTTVLFSICLRDHRDFLTAVKILMAAACFKIAVAAWFQFTIARPMAFEPPYLTTHNDSILFVIVFMLLVIRFIHQLTTRNLVSLLLIGSYVFFGIVINNRRLAFVNLLVCLALVLFIMRGPAKKFVVRGIMLSLPFLLAYVVVGGNRNGAVFKPANLIMSVVTQKDASSATRDIENFNLIVTLKQGKVLGNGWGHEYIEMVKAYDISEAFAQYRFIAHNSVLWLLSIGGFFGFTLLWMPMAAGVFLARRAYFFARTPDERTTSVLVICMIAIYMMQAWGDMGVICNIATFTVAMALAAAGKLAVATGAFPARPRLIGTRSQAAPVRVSIGSSLPEFV